MAGDSAIIEPFGIERMNAPKIISPMAIPLAVLLLLAAPAGVQGGFTWITNVNSTISITRYTGPPWVVIIPTNINNLPVTSFGTAFNNQTNLTSIIIPSTIASIDEAAFTGCTNLTNVTIPAGVTSIGGQAFSGCSSLASVTIPNSVSNIGSFAFGGCTSLTSVTMLGLITGMGVETFEACDNLTNVIIAKGLLMVPEEAFYECPKLVSVAFPSSVTNIGEYAFAYCSSLTALYFASNYPTADSTAFYADSLTVYYLPGTTGWADFSTNTGIPAVLRDPLIETGESRFGFTNSQFGFNITTTNTLTVVVEAATNLVNPVWIPLQTDTLTNGSFYFSDPRWTNYPSRFYGLGFP